MSQLTYIRIIQACISLKVLELYINKKMLYGNLEYLDVTKYYSCKGRELMVEFLEPYDTKIVCQFKGTLEFGVHYSLFLYSNQGQTKSFLLNDNIYCSFYEPPFVKVCFLNFLPNTLIDIEADDKIILKAVPPIWVDKIGSALYTELETGLHQINIVESKNGETILTTKIFAQPKKNITLFLIQPPHLSKISDACR